MFGIGMPEVMLICVLALLVFGPKELPKIARTIGKAMGELRRASDELRDGIQREIDQVEREERASAPSPETVPVTPSVDTATTPASSDGAVQAPASEATEAGAVSSEPVAGVSPAEPSLPVPEGQTAEAKSEECVAGSAPAVEPETSKSEVAPEEPGKPSQETQTATPPSTQPAETRNA